MAMTLRLLFVALLFAPVSVAAQFVAGSVTDSAGRPLAGADVIVIVGQSQAPESQVRGRTDERGRFRVSVPRGGSKVLRVRLIGFRPFETTVPGSDARFHRVILQRSPQLLAAVVVRDRDACDPTSLRGFQCRRDAGVGHFRDAAEIRALRPQHWADMLDGMPGVRRSMSMGPHGLEWRVAAPPGRCFVELWNGQPASKQMPDDPFPPDQMWKSIDVVAIEYYENHPDVPPRFQALAWPPLGQKCGLIIYWLRGASRAP